MTSTYFSNRAVKATGECGDKRTRRSLSALLFATMAFALASCASNPTLTVAPEDWTYGSKAIAIDVKATADLNNVSERPHALALGIFQLSDTNTFTGLATTREGAVELLSKGKIDATVVQFTRVIVQPGETKSISLDRAQTAKYVGVISGYQELNPSIDVRVFPVPLVPNKRGVVDSLLVASTLIANEAKATPGKLYLNVELEGQGTRSMKDVTKDHSTD